MRLAIVILTIFFSLNQMNAQVGSCTYVPNDPGTGCSFEEIVWPVPSSWWPCCAGAATGTFVCTLPGGAYRIGNVTGLESTGISSRVQNGTGTNRVVVFQTTGNNVVIQNTFGSNVFFWFNFKMPTNIAVDPGVSYTARFELQRRSEDGSWIFYRTVNVPVLPLQKPYFVGPTSICTSDPEAFLSVVVARNTVPPLVECEPGPSGNTLTWTITNGWLINGQPGPVTTTTASVQITKGSSQSDVATLCVSPTNFNWYIPGNTLCQQLHIGSSAPQQPADIILTNLDCTNCTMNAAVTPVGNALRYQWSTGLVSSSTTGPPVALNTPTNLCVVAINGCGTSPSRCKNVFECSEKVCPGASCPYAYVETPMIIGPDYLCKGSTTTFYLSGLPTTANWFVDAPAFIQSSDATSADIFMPEGEYSIGVNLGVSGTTFCSSFFDSKYLSIPELPCFLLRPERGAEDRSAAQALEPEISIAPTSLKSGDIVRVALPETSVDGHYQLIVVGMDGKVYHNIAKASGPTQIQTTGMASGHYKIAVGNSGHIKTVGFTIVD